MTEHDATGDTLADQLVDDVSTLERHPTTHLLLADSHHLDGLYQVVAEPMVELALHLPDFSFRLFRKGAADVLTDDTPTVSYDVIQQKIQGIRKQVMHPQREYHF